MKLLLRCPYCASDQGMCRYSVRLAMSGFSFVFGILVNFFCSPQLPNSNSTRRLFLEFLSTYITIRVFYVCILCCESVKRYHFKFRSIIHFSTHPLDVTTYYFIVLVTTDTSYYGAVCSFELLCVQCKHSWNWQTAWESRGATKIVNSLLLGSILYTGSQPTKVKQ